MILHHISQIHRFSTKIIVCVCVCVPVCVLRGWHAWTQLNSGGNCRLSNSSCVDQLCLHVVCVQTEAVVWPSLRSLRSAYVAPQRPFILQPCVFPLPPLWSLFYFTWVIVASLKQMWFLTFNIIKQSTVKYLKLTTWGFFFSPNTPRLHLYSELSHRLCFSVFNYSASNWLKVSANQASSWGGPWPPSGNHAEPFLVRVRDDGLTLKRCWILLSDQSVRRAAGQARSP